MEARSEGTQNLESSAKRSTGFRDRKQRHGNVGKGRVEANLHSKGRDSGGEDEGKRKIRIGDRSSPGKVAGSNMAMANECESCKGVASPIGDVIIEENWTSGSTQNRDDRADSQRKVSGRYGFVSQYFEWVQQRKSVWLTLKSTTLQAKNYVVPRVESSCLWARTCLINIARLWLVIFVLWLNCCVRGIGSFLHLGMAAFFVLLWCSFLSSIAIVGFIYVLSTMVITCVAAFVLGNTYGILIMFSLGALMLWMYGSFWITGTFVLIGGIFLASSYPHVAILITTIYSIYCAKVHVGWLGSVFCVNMAFISSDILLYFLKESVDESEGQTSSDQAKSSKNRGRHFYTESTKPYSSDGGAGSSGRPSGESFHTNQLGGLNTGPSTGGQAEPISNLAEEEVMRLLDSPDYYATLGLSRFEDINSATLKREYRKKAMLVHPDKNMGNVKAEEAFKKLQNAYEALLDLDKKKIYDEELQREELLRSLNMFRSGAKKNGRYGASEYGFIFAEDDFEDLHVESRRIACKKCSGSHIWMHTGRAKARARWCQDCQDYHQAKDGDGWIEQSVQPFFFGILQKVDLPRAYACVDSRIFDVTEWVGCQGMKCTPNTHKPTFHINTTIMGKGPACGRSQGYKDTANGGMATNFNENMTEEEFFKWLANAMATGTFDSGDGAQENSNMETNSRAKNSKKKRKGKRQL
ncbi:uncharacterized protein LOC131075937 isoform X1 [Cryptomeria japonica]|uniref:uncharacterized protein LOC131075937 isoform X1 n=1 Tax=Cryptomeria japonica TaxID=3369 RepID=UPI0027DA33CA|nr:uncharacterized protein LOC131075937 isoform X1 [Cryptomeria japonica]XP_057868887.2 uncharacterized protein LOC131075937 isoform X1 [Cryptomeria japonica]XP_057868888.2 uncharacterized protein LOC131075937 isoform X1 [Cryptomeria japonica]XP_057868889.2 uncharacterized protein LOC131075937 isoform X1 [Cryptomeria japonica]